VRDKRLRLLLAVTILLRLIAAVAWPFEKCVRDECMYMNIAERMVEGLGMTASNGWLWAPGYPAILALHRFLFTHVGAAQVTQAFISGAAAILLYRIGQRVFEDPGRDRPALIAAWLFALSPTLAFFSASLWSEVFYAFFLLLAIRRALLTSEALDTVADRPGLGLSLPWFRHVLLGGFLLGCCVLLRGVATYMLPVFSLGLLWRRFRLPRAWVAAALLFGTAALTVAPYSLYISKKFDAFIITDRTLGQMMWLGDNDFPPITFDWGNGPLTEVAYDAHTAEGRPHCAVKRTPIERDDCETAAGKQWILDHPREFLARVPLRLAQTFNPHSFLTRHLRQGRWPGIPGPTREILSLLVVAFSFVTVLGGAIGVSLRRGGMYRVIVVLTIGYHLAAFAALAGLSRYRVPLDMVWMPFAGAFLASPRLAFQELRASPARAAGAILLVLLLLGLMLWFLPNGFPWWQSW
jgi:hypothetical protein